MVTVPNSLFGIIVAIQGAHVDSGVRSTIRKENIAAHVQKQGGGLGLLAMLAQKEIPQRQKTKATTEGVGKNTNIQHLITEEVSGLVCCSLHFSPQPLVFGV